MYTYDLSNNILINQVIRTFILCIAAHAQALRALTRATLHATFNNSIIWPLLVTAPSYTLTENLRLGVLANCMDELGTNSNRKHLTTVRILVIRREQITTWKPETIFTQFQLLVTFNYT